MQLVEKRPDGYSSNMEFRFGLDLSSGPPDFNCRFPITRQATKSLQVIEFVDGGWGKVAVGLTKERKENGIEICICQRTAALIEKYLLDSNTSY